MYWQSSSPHVDNDTIEALSEHSQALGFGFIHGDSAEQDEITQASKRAEPDSDFPQPAKSKRGRPHGSRDSFPRKRRYYRIVKPAGVDNVGDGNRPGSCSSSDSNNLVCEASLGVVKIRKIVGKIGEVRNFIPSSAVFEFRSV